jgi:hypothetical protein
MSSNYAVSGTDLDAIFAPRAGSSPAGATGLKVAGVDLNDRYHASSGGDQIASNTGYLAGGTDLRFIFRGIAYQPPVVTSAATYGVDAGAAASYTITASNSPTSFSASGLPSGLSVNTSTGVISGSTHQTGVFNVTIGASNAWGSGSKLLVLTIRGPAVTLSGQVDVYIGSYGSDGWTYTADYPGIGLSQVRFQVTGHGSGAWVSVSGDTYSGSSTWSDPFGSPDISHSPGTYLFFFEAQGTDGLIGRAELTVTVH